jgi:hypothetical protein
MEEELYRLSEALNIMRLSFNNLNHEYDIEMHDLRQSQRHLEKFIVALNEEKIKSDQE